jgi:hypothetical protein
MTYQFYRFALTKRTVAEALDGVYQPTPVRAGLRCVCQH